MHLAILTSFLSKRAGKGFAGSMATHLVASGSASPDHVLTRELPCVCRTCRTRLLCGLIPAVEHGEECLMMAHMEPFEHKAIVITAPTTAVIAEQKRMPAMTNGIRIRFFTVHSFSLQSSRNL